MKSSSWSAQAGLGTAYLIERDGFLFQSPIAWYARARRWDLPPGYEKTNSHFERPITSACLFCHANRAEPVEGTVNRYRPPIFRATRSAASGAMGRVSSMSAIPRWSTAGT